MFRSFYKMHGLGNDFVIFDSRADEAMPSTELCRRIAHRTTGVGCDQLIVLLKPQAPEADVRMRIVNADGSEVATCGNATRCVARLLFEETGRKEAVIQTKVALLRVKAGQDGLISVDFGEPSLAWDAIPIARAMDTLTVPVQAGGYADPCCVGMGNPHAVFFVPDVASVPLATVGPKLETDPMFPERCNIEFAQVLDRARIRMRVWERGTGITQACGSGSCATLVAAVRRGLADRRATIVLDGGFLVIEWRENDGHVLMEGPATLAFRGELTDEV